MSMVVKPHKSFEEQLNVLKRRGLTIEDPDEALLFLRRVNYYKFTAYLLSFKQADGSYDTNASFSKACDLYMFDLRLRNLLLFIIEPIEIFIKTQIAYQHSLKYGPLGYRDSQNFIDAIYHAQMLNKLDDMINSEKANLLFVKHHVDFCDGNFPLWVAIELLSFTSISMFYSNMHTRDRKQIARDECNLNHLDLRNWLRGLCIVRNFCAHNRRLYYFNFNYSIFLPKNCGFNPTNKIFDFIYAAKLIYPDIDYWNNNVLASLKSLVDEHSYCVPLNHIGFPDKWCDLLTIKVRSNGVRY